MAINHDIETIKSIGLSKKLGQMERNCEKLQSPFTSAFFQKPLEDTADNSNALDSPGMAPS